MQLYIVVEQKWKRFGAVSGCSLYEKVTDQICPGTGVVLPYSSDCRLHRSCAEILDEVEVKSCVGTVRDDGDVCQVGADEHTRHQGADALAQLRELAR